MFNPGMMLTPGALGGGIGAYLPTALGSRLRAWLDASDLSSLQQAIASGGTAVTTDADPVGTANDKSGAGNHATTPTNARRPLYKDQGGIKYLSFDGSDDVLAAPIFARAMPFTIMLAFRMGTLAGSDVIVAPSGNTATNYSGAIGQTSNSSTLGLGFPPAAAVDFGTNAWGVLTAVFNGASSSLQKNNDTPVTGNAGSAVNTGFMLGGELYSGTYYIGPQMDVAQAVFVEGTMTAPELAALKTFVAAKALLTL